MRLGCQLINALLVAAPGARVRSEADGPDSRLQLCVVGLTYFLILLPSMELFAAEQQAEVTIEQVQWGFDGKAKPRTFVPLSVLVQNNSPGEFEGTLRLKKSLQFSKQIDAVIERDVYIGPLSSRWVQLVPYVFDDWEQWQLTWVDLEAEPFDVPTPKSGDRATVLVYDPDQLQSTGGILHRFPSDLFPTSVTALDGLRGIVLDQPPGWQGARCDAFLDWLNLGGRVYLLQNEQGQYPAFPEGLSVLNQRGDRVPVGSGVVQRLSRSVSSLDAEAVHNEILHDEQGRFNTAEWRKLRETMTFQGGFPLMNRSGWDRDTELLERLQSLSRFERNWIAVYGLAFLYLLALFPGCYLLGRRLKTYEWFYAGFLVVTGLFSVGFVSLGRLGTTDLGRIRTVAVARQLEEGLYDVTGWSSAAAKVGGDYTIQHEGEGRLYAAGSELEAVQGRVVNGPEGRLEAAMPPASTRAALYRARQPGPSLGIQVERIALDAGMLSQLSLSVGPEFPAEPLAVYVCHEARVYKISHTGGEWRLAPSSRKSAVVFLTDLTDMQFTTFWGINQPSDSNEGEISQDEAYSSLARRLIGNSFGLDSVIDPIQLTLAPDRMRVFVYARMPPELLATGEDFPDQSGCVLYAIDVPTSQSPRVSPTASTNRSDLSVPGE